MKKVEKNDWFKWTGIILLIAIIFSWIIVQSQIINGVLDTTSVTPVGIFQLAYYLLEGFGYVSQLFPIIIIVPGIYAVLGATRVYSKLTDSIAARFEHQKKLFVALSALLYACLAGISTNYLSLIALIPFTISILAKLKVDKIVGLMATFGGILVGTLGATYSPGLLEAATVADYGLGITYGYELVGAIVLFALAYLLLLFFTFGRMDKELYLEEGQALVDKFDTYKEKKVSNTKKVKPNVDTTALAIILFLMFIVTILAFIGWEKVFSIGFFTDIHEAILEATLFGETIFANILGVITPYSELTVFYEFGRWELFQLSMFLVLGLLLIKLVYRIPMNFVVDKFVNGVKTSVPTIMVLTLIYAVVYISVQYHPTVPYLINNIIDSSANLYTAFISGGIMSIFGVEFSIVVRSIGSLFSTFKNLDVIVLALQSVYGLVSFIAPTSVVLMIGLTTLDIKFKDYVKFIGKFLIILSILTIIVLTILMYA